MMIPIKTFRRKKRLPDKKRVYIISLLAFLAGIVNGFLGTGGGILLTAVMTMLPAACDNDIRDRFAAVIAVILPLSFISAAIYGENIQLGAAIPYLFPGMLGGICGALLLDKISLRWLKKLFALMMLWAGVNFL